MHTHIAARPIHTRCFTNCCTPTSVLGHSWPTGWLRPLAPAGVDSPAECSQRLTATGSDSLRRLGEANAFFLNVDETSVVEREMDGKETLPAPFPYFSHNVILSEPIN